MRSCPNRNRCFRFSAVGPGGIPGRLVARLFPALLFVVASHVCAGKAAVARGTPPPDVTWVTLDGDSLSWSELRGDRPLVAVFWTTWCSTCRKELPKLVALEKELSNREFTPAWASINVGEPAKKAGPEAEKRHLPGVRIVDPDEVNGKILGIHFVPTICVLDMEGKIVYWGKSDMKKVKNLVDKMAGGAAVEEHGS